MKLIGIWEPWPSRISSQWPLCDGEVFGIKIRRNHSKPIEFKVYLFVKVVYTQSGVLIEGIHVV